MNDQLEFAARDTKTPSQVDRMIALLRERAGEDVPMPELAKAATENQQGVAFCVSRRMGDVRERGKAEGFQVFLSRREWKHGHLHTWYRLEYIDQP